MVEMLHHGEHAPVPTILRPVAGITWFGSYYLFWATDQIIFGRAKNKTKKNVLYYLKNTSPQFHRQG